VKRRATRHAAGGHRRARRSRPRQSLQRPGPAPCQHRRWSRGGPLTRPPGRPSCSRRSPKTPGDPRALAATLPLSWSPRVGDHRHQPGGGSGSGPPRSRERRRA